MCKNRFVSWQHPMLRPVTDRGLYPLRKELSRWFRSFYFIWTVLLSVDTGSIYLTCLTYPNHLLILNSYFLKDSMPRKPVTSMWSNISIPLRLIWINYRLLLLQLLNLWLHYSPLLCSCLLCLGPPCFTCHLLYISLGIPSVVLWLKKCVKHTFRATATHFFYGQQ